MSVELRGWTRGWNSELEGSEVDDEVEGREVSLAVIPKDRSMGEQSSVSHAGRWLDPVGCGIVKFCRRAPSRKSSVDNRKSSSSMSASSTPSRWRKLLDADRPLGMTAPRPMARSYLLIDTIPRYWIKRGKKSNIKTWKRARKHYKLSVYGPVMLVYPYLGRSRCLPKEGNAQGKTDPHKRAEKVHPHTLRNKSNKSRKGEENDEKSRDYTQNET